MDVMYLALGIGFFAVSALMMRFFSRLTGE